MQDLNDKITGNTLTAAEWNEVPSEIQNVIEGLGITLSGADLNQLGKAIAGYVANGDFYTDSGAANAYVLTKIGSKQAPAAYTNGFEVNFVAGNPNAAGASTINVAGLGVKSITDGGGNNPGAGEISGRTRCVFDSANNRFELIKGGIVNTTIISASSTYNPPPGVKSLEFTAIGGGGGGGGVDGQGAGTGAISAGGGGGGASTKITNIIESSYTITIGAGGAGGAAGNNNGSSGGTTTITSTNVNLTATGGSGGSGDLGTSTLTSAGRTSPGSGSGGDLNLDGSYAAGGGHNGASRQGIGLSGASILGGAVADSNNSNADNAVNFGAGGGGTTSLAVAANYSGGDGGDGVVIVKEFF